MKAGVRVPGSPGETILLGGIICSRMTRAELADAMLRDVEAARSGALAEPRLVVYANGDVVARYHSDPGYRALIDAADIVDVDGMPLVLMSKLLCKHALRERVATTDFVLDASAAAARAGTRFYLLGAKPGVAKEAAANLTKAFPGLQIVGARDGYFAPDQEEQVCADVRASGADVLWLGLGSPYQERFAARNRARLGGLAWVHTCGGLFDFYAKRVPRAPTWVQDTGFEWLFRAMVEPRRLSGRYLRTNPVALYHLLTKTRG